MAMLGETTNHHLKRRDFLSSFLALTGMAGASVARHVADNRLVGLI